MKIDKIKPIPKYIVNRIKATDSKDRTIVPGRTRFYAYLTKNDGELVKVTVAVKQQGKNWFCKQVVVHGIHSDVCFGKDIGYTYLGGYTVGWYDLGLYKNPRWLDCDGWGFGQDKLFDPYAPLVNKEYVLEHFPEYKYSAVDLYKGCELFKYLRLYEEYPQIEYLMKLGLQNLAMSKQILRLAGKDVKFRKWLAKNRKELSDYKIIIPSVLKAYKTHRPITETNNYIKARNSLTKDRFLKPLAELFKNDLERFFSYIAEQDISPYSYKDYYNACTYLGLDMSIDKNRYPHNFKHWHDIRTDEYNTAKALKDEQERKELYNKFAAVARKYLGLEYDKKSVYIAIIPQKPSDLINEGELLHHCVGRMGYDQKFAREETLIFFIRAKEQPDIPLVTVEYSPTQKSVLQCYGDHDSKPSEEIMTFVNKKWLPYANRQLKQLAA